MSQGGKSTEEQVAEIDQKISRLEGQIVNLENRADLLNDQPRSTALEQADIANEIQSSRGEIDALRGQKQALLDAQRIDFLQRTNDRLDTEWDRIDDNAYGDAARKRQIRDEMQEIQKEIDELKAKQPKP